MVKLLVSRSLEKEVRKLIVVIVCPQSGIQVGRKGEIGETIGTTKLAFGILMIMAYSVYASLSLFFPVSLIPLSGCSTMLTFGRW
jgi:hypothetical protein